MERVVFAVPHNDYVHIQSALNEDEWLISENAVTQEKSIDVLKEFSAQYFVFHSNLEGTRGFKDFCRLITDYFPELTLIEYRDNSDEIVDMLMGNKEIPEFLNRLLDNDDKDNEGSYSKESIFDETKQSSEDEHQMWKRITEKPATVDHLLNIKLAISGFSGGTGKTDIAINFCAWAAKNNFKVALLGFNLQNDNLEERLGVERVRSKGILAAHDLYQTNEMDLKALEDTMYHKFGFKILLGPEAPEFTEEMDDTQFYIDVINVLQPEYDFVVVDMENNNYSPAWLDVLLNVDHVLIPCTTHISHLNDLRRGLKNLKDRYDFHLSKVDIVFNRANEGGHVTRELINRNTGREVIATVPYSKDFIRSSELERPLVTKPTAVRVQKGFDQLLFRYSGTRNKTKDLMMPAYIYWRKEIGKLAKRIITFNKSS